MAMDIQLPDGSLYFWMYKMGLKHVPLDEIERAVATGGRVLRTKDVENYWNGWYRSRLYMNGNEGVPIFDQELAPIRSRFPKWSELSDHPFLGQPEIANRWVPCNSSMKPMIKWSRGCMLKSEAAAMRGCSYLAENLKGCQFIAIDFDGDHGSDFDMDCILLGNALASTSLAYLKPETVDGMSVSLHVLFAVDKVVPTMHFTKAHIDIIGNKENSIRYLKNKQSNLMPMAPMTEEAWEMIMGYIRRKENE